MSERSESPMAEESKRPAQVPVAGSVGTSENAQVPTRVARRHLRALREAAHYPITRAAVLRLILKAGFPLVRKRRNKWRLVAPFVKRQCHLLLQELADQLMVLVSQHASILTEFRRSQTLTTEDMRYAVRLMMGQRVLG